MTDVSIAPPAPPPSAPSAPPAPPPPSRGEAPIVADPVRAPQPLSDHGPAKPATEPAKRFNSPREAIQDAFKKAQEKGRPGAAEAKKGHNAPPEDTPDEPPIDLRKRPSDQARERGEGGRFVPREQPGSPQLGENSPNQGKAPAQQVAPLPEHAPYREPVQRMTPAARQEWARTPEPVRADMHRMHAEFQRAYQGMRADVELAKELRPYIDEARQGGTTLSKVVGNFKGIEQKLLSDPIGGLDFIVNNLGLQTTDGRRATLEDVAYHVLSQSREQRQVVQTQNHQSALAQRMAQQQQYIEHLARQQQHMQHQETVRATSGAVDRFAEANPRLDELADLIVNEINLGFDLPTAYRRANMLRPASGNTAAQTRATAPQTRTVNRSISGAPDHGPGNGAMRAPKQMSLKESAAHAIRQARGAI